MDINEQKALIQEAIRRYPPGTVYWNLNLIGGRSQAHREPHELPVIHKDVQFKFDERTYSYDCNPLLTVHQKGTTAGWVYSNGIWADIYYTPIKIYDLWI